MIGGDIESGRANFSISEWILGFKFNQLSYFDFLVDDSCYDTPEIRR